MIRFKDHLEETIGPEFWDRPLKQLFDFKIAIDKKYEL